jgi:hypothetical protein
LAEDGIWGDNTKRSMLNAPASGWWKTERDPEQYSGSLFLGMRFTCNRERRRARSRFDTLRR